MKLWKTIACAVAAAVVSTPAFAQSGKPMKIIVPYAAGGVTAAVAREMASRIAELRGTPVIVENKPGASSMIGMEACAKAAPDGLTTCIAVPDSLSYNPQLFANLPYDPDKDFAPVINLGFTNNLLVASAYDQHVHRDDRSGRHGLRRWPERLLRFQRPQGRRDGLAHDERQRDARRDPQAAHRDLGHERQPLRLARDRRRLPVVGRLDAAGYGHPSLGFAE